MLCIFFEGNQYVDCLNQITGLKPVECSMDTRYGSISYLKYSDQLIAILDAAFVPGNQCKNTPKIVAALLEKLNVTSFCYIAKVGGINKILHVGDLLMIDDAVDKTTQYDKSYIMGRKQFPPRYDMLEPFCKEWRTDIFKKLLMDRPFTDKNMFDCGTYVCTDGPAFETASEISEYANSKIDVVGHYLFPYVYYLRELKISMIAVTIVSNSFAHDDGFLLDDSNMMSGMKKILAAVINTCNDNYCEKQKSHWIKNI